MRTIDVGDNTVTWEYDEGIVIHAIVPHFEDADPVTEERATDAVIDYLRDEVEAAKSAAWDSKIDEARGK